MKIKGIWLRGYKSISEQTLLLDENFNVLAGKNNVGKTALIEAIYRSFQGFIAPPNDTNDYSRDKKNVINSGIVDMKLIVKLEETSKYIDIFGWSTLVLELRAFRGKLSLFYLEGRENENEPSNAKNLLEWDRGSNSFFNHYRTKIDESINGYPREVYDFMNDLRDSLVFISNNRTPLIEGETVKGVETLNITASNLQTFLLTLNSNKRKVFIDVEKAFKGIFPEIRYLLPTLEDTKTILKVEFEDIPNAIPLQDCGSGYTQILVLLCVLFSEEQRVILFDEPQTFLHPYAEREIYKLVAMHQKHQFIFTTHSPVLINYPARKNLFLVSKENGSTKYELMNTAQKIFKEIGALNSDFALAERVLFVEGDTEKYALPLILGHFGMEQIGYNYSIVRIRATGNEFKDEQLMIRNAKMYSELFTSISEQNIPYCIFLDRDERKAEKIAKTYGKELITTVRRELENYFLNADAIVSIIGMYDLQVYPNKNEIELLLMELFEEHTDKKLFPKGCNGDSKTDVVGSEVLERIFSKYKIRYNKPEHGRLFTEWLLENSPDDLCEIAELLRPFLS